MSRLVRVSPITPEAEPIREAAELIQAGRLVAFPTETVYGLGANALDEDAVGRVFEAKGRPAYNPLIAHVADLGAARELARHWSEMADRLASAFWPGPLTLVVPRAPHLPGLLTAGLPSVAVRMPAHPVALALISAARVPIAAPSANRFTRLSPTTAQHVAQGLGDRIDLILDGGATRVGIESTVLDLTGPQPRLLRPGMLGVNQIEAVAGPVLAAPQIEGEAPRPSPGMTERHYAPLAQLRTVSAAELAGSGTHTIGGEGSRTGAIVHSAPDPLVAQVIRLPAEPGGYARGLYDALHQLDAAGCQTVLVEHLPQTPAWAGVRDRLRRAAAAG